MRSAVLRALVPLWGIVALALVLAGCSTGEPSAGLLNVLDLAPRDAEVGDRLELIGTGFPEGKSATVSFRGDLFRPGVEPLRDIEIVASATATTQNRISLTLSEELQARFCGRGDSADHTTFRGDVIATFPARASGAPPIVGAVRDVVLDVNGPAVSAEVQAARDEEARLAFQFIGVEADTSAPSAIAIRAVTPGGRAEQGGLLPGDVLVAIDDVTVKGTSDVTFSGASRLAKISVRRGRLKEPVSRAIDVEGFRPAAPRELAVAGVLVAVAAMLFMLWLAPIGKLFGWIERRVASRLRDKRRAKDRGPLARVGRLLSTMHDSLNEGLVPDSEPLPLRLVPYLSFLAISAGATLIAFGRPLVSRDLDLPLAYGGSLTALMTVALMSGGWSERRRWSFFAGIKSALSTLALQLPVLAALGCVVLSMGSVRLSDAVHAQGALPWTWNAFKNPALFAALGLVLIASIPQTRRARGILAEADLDAPGQRGGVMFYAEWCHLLVVASLAAVLLLGGWQLPAGTPTGGTSIGWLAAGALLLQVKTWAVAGAIVLLRWALPGVRADQMLGVFWRWLLPLTLLVLGVSALWAASLQHPTLRSVEPVLGYALFGVTLGVALKFMRAVQTHVQAGAPPMHVNPWL